MPKTQLVLYREQDVVAVDDWLAGQNSDVRIKAIRLLGLLAERGHELRRPLADFLRDGIYELRIDLRHRRFRILYFFHGQAVVVLSHGLHKEREVPAVEIDRAVDRKRRFEASPGDHTATW